MTPENKLVVLSEYPLHNKHVGYSLIYDLHGLFLSWGIPVLDVAHRYPPEEKSNAINRFRNPYCIPDVERVCDIGSQLLVICSGPHFLRSLASLGKNVNRFSSISVYFTDSFDSCTLNGFGASILKGVDRVFSGIEEIADDLKVHHGVEHSYFLPFGIDALTYARTPNKNLIDVFGYGRIDQQFHNQIQRVFGSFSSPYTYVHSTFESASIHDMREHRQLHWKLMSSSSINLCFESSRTPRFLNRSPVLYRWFEAWAAGNLVVGSRPKCRSADKLMGWENSTVELPVDPNDAPDALVELLADRDRLKSIQLENQFQVLRRHDWRFRIAQLFGEMSISLPCCLKEQLEALNALGSTGVLLKPGTRSIC